MDKIIREGILFLISFIIVFILYRLLVVRKALRKKNPKEPREVVYLVDRYKLDLEKVNYKRLVNVISLVSSLDIALIVSVILLFKNFYLEIIVGFVFTLIIILISYHLVYLVYKRGGMIKNDTKRNRK